MPAIWDTVYRLRRGELSSQGKAGVNCPHKDNQVTISTLGSIMKPFMTNNCGGMLSPELMKN